ncbi:MAG: arginine deiminase-related protein [Candidatus Omnitrophota bacterium]|nr:arginine deiminase-related protein [Candidatus Omnitrophota bacterium]
MCRPTHYTIAYEINPWMSLKRQANHRRALQQWTQLYALLTKTLRVPVKLLGVQRAVPDLVFTANAGLVSGRVFIRSNFRHPQRQREEPIVERHFRGAGFRVVRLPNRFDFEGEGDALWMNDTLLFGFRFRSDAPVHTYLARVLKARVLPIELADRRFYHLDTCLAPLDQRCALWFPKAFDRYGRKVIEGMVADPISVSEADAKRFVCNAIAIGRSIVLQEGFSTTLKRALTRRGFQLYPVDLSEFLKAGGSAKCLVLRLGR